MKDEGGRMKTGTSGNGITKKWPGASNTASIEGFVLLFILHPSAFIPSHLPPSSFILT
jgi:hypothetical protein